MKGSFEVATPQQVERRAVEGTCPACGAEALAAYPVCTEGGWFDVVKCQECLHSVSRERGPLLGPIVLLIDVMKGGSA
ncbi:hypothetical protein [Microbacterium sp. No. 7]|uniref:hypothetical protein n=1 Tax=Microbacterium sp. No. 7 TaxID=1714373 RepID=UPI0006D0C58F|nr:hypothetical protein [Microbacterium sp. No. 7]ALJ19281.1 hypothetical protein AOA12_04930 [Microbacterium sp. No. 7]